MISLFNRKKENVFECREKQQKVWRLIRRIIDTGSQVNAPEDCSSRAYDRYNRCVPILIAPLTEGTEQFDVEELTYAVTKDFSDCGLSFITTAPLDSTEVLCGFWTGRPQLLHALVRHTRPFGGGLFEVGLEFIEVVECSLLITSLNHELASLSTEDHADENQPSYIDG